MGTRSILQVLKMFQVFFPVPVQVECERFILKPYNPFFPVPVPVPVPVPDQASVNTPLDLKSRLDLCVTLHSQNNHEFKAIKGREMSQENIMISLTQHGSVWSGLEET